jgi:hypothetical protein
MAVLAAGVGRLYGSKDESNGRVNPALEPDYDMEPSYLGVNQAEPGGGGKSAAISKAESHHSTTAVLGTCHTQNSTAF